MNDDDDDIDHSALDGGDDNAKDDGDDNGHGEYPKIGK